MSNSVPTYTVMKSSSDSESEYESEKCFTTTRKHTGKVRKLITFCWDNISVWRKKEKEKESFWKGKEYENTQLLHNVYGFVNQNSLMAIMGPSGCGKTTFLATISFRIKEKIEGNVYINGEAINAEQMLALSGFVPQHDLTVESLTVFEHMKLMAILKIDRNVSEIQRLKKIIRLMDDLGISESSSTNICNLSGGERKRLSIAVQLLTDPLFLFCDEPTTGLDSAGTMMVVKLLKKFSSTGKIVICSIHQPPASIFELFDDVLLLASGGRVAYFGSASETINYFRRLNLHCPPSYNIAEFIIDQVSVSDFGASRRIKTLCNFYKSSKTSAIIEERIKAACFNNYLSSDRSTFFPEFENKKGALSKYYSVKKATLRTQCTCLVWRSVLDLRKNYLNYSTHIVTYLVSATVMSLIFSQVTLCSENSIQNIRGFINIIVLETLYMFAYYEFNTFIAERALILREVSSGLYSSKAYYLSKLCCKIFHSCTEPVLFVFIIRNISKVFRHLTFFEFVLPFVLVSAMSSAYGCMLSSIFDNFNVLMVIATAHEIPAYLLAGITYKISSLPAILSSLKYFSIFYYSIEVVTVLEWSKIDNIQCNLTNRYVTNEEDRLTPLEILTDYGFDVVDYQDDLWIMIIFTIIFHITAYKFISYKNKKQAAAY